MGGDIAIAKNLRAAGFSQEQSKTLAESISESIVVGVATKIDISGIEDGIKDRNFQIACQDECNTCHFNDSVEYFAGAIVEAVILTLSFPCPPSSFPSPVCTRARRVGMHRRAQTSPSAAVANRRARRVGMHRRAQNGRPQELAPSVGRDAPTNFSLFPLFAQRHALGNK